MRGATVLSLAASLAIVAGGAVAEEPKLSIIRAGVLIDGSGKDVRRDVIVVIRDQRIAEIRDGHARRCFRRPCARSLGLLIGVSDVGTIAVGQYADLVAVPRNPLEDVRVLETIPFVMKGGRIVKDVRPIER
jgi:imidazolonepropionase-like amidohydrolase